MKYINYITGGVLFALLLAGCSDEFEKEPIVLPDNYTLLNIKWQYGKDTVRVYCPEAAEGFRTADYTVQEATDVSSGTSTGYLVKNGETGVRWGDTGKTHNFYAFYSLDRIDEGLQTGTTVTATIPTGQEGGKLLTYNNDGNEDPNGTFKIITPDMSFCMMAGKGTWNPEDDNPEDDKNVALTFSPIVTVLDVLINGPEDVEFMNIVSVSVRSKSGKNIVGTFSYNLADNTYNFDATDKSETAASIATVQTIIDNNPVSLKKNEQLNVKFFLLPREISDGDLVVSVLTEGGVVYSKTISGTGTTPGAGGEKGDGILDAGLITRIKTPKLGGQEANNWMSQIPDNALFTQLSLPGSKHAFSYNTAESFDPNTGISHYYQALPPLEIRSGETGTFKTTQFDEGVRVFDVHLNLTSDSRYATPIVYAGGANLDPEYTLSDVLTALNEKVNPENETASECAVVFLNYVQAATSNISTWLSAVMNSLNTWNTNNKIDGKDILTKIDGTTTMGAVRGKIAVIINLRTTDKPSGSAPVNYINNFSTSVQNTDIVSAQYSSGATVRIQNLQQCNNPSFSDGGGFAYRDDGIGVVPYFIAVANHDDSNVSCNLLNTKKNLMKKLNQKIAEGGTNLYINDLSGFCVTKNRESTGYAHYGTVRSALGGAITWSNDAYAYDYKDFTGYTVVTNLDDLGLGGLIDIRENVCLNMAEIGNGGNTCLFAELFNGEAVTEYSSLVGGLRQPLGIVLMNFAGVANVTIGTRNYAVQGIRLPGLIMMNNFMFPLKTGTTKAESYSKVSYSKGGDLWD